MPREFRDLRTLSEAREIIQRSLPEHMRQGRFGARDLPIAEAVGCVLHEAISSPVDLPAFDRSTMDGYAVRAQDTFGASEGLPTYLTVAGEVRMGQPADVPLGYQQCARIPTGGMLPCGADAVVMVEHTQPWGEDSVEVLRPVAPDENVVRRGDDVRKGASLLRAGRRLRPQDISALAGLGISQVTVRRPRIGVLSTGSELARHREPLPPGKIYDMNGPALCAAVRALGAEAADLGLVKDEREALCEALLRGIATADMVLVSGGTSVGAEDLIPEVLASLGPPGVIVHGLAVRPGKPVVVAMAGDVPVFGLPGHPTSALIIFRELVAPLIELATGRQELRQPLVSARLTRNIASQIGREDLVRVKLAERDGELQATPLLGPSALISSLLEADGLVRLPAEAEGLYAGEMVEVEMLG